MPIKRWRRLPVLDKTTYRRETYEFAVKKNLKVGAGVRRARIELLTGGFRIREAKNKPMWEHDRKNSKWPLPSS
jgi:hypothetical protein